MKRCPNCNDFALYDDNVNNCPICDAVLVPYTRSGSSSSVIGATSGAGNSSVRPVRPNNQNRVRTSTENTPPPFEERRGFRYHYRGLITEINPHARLHTRLKKWINSIFRGEPYQLGNTTHETVIRVEEFHPGRVSGRKRDFIFYGDVEGRFNYGDDVSITAKKRRDRYIVTRMYLNETESPVRPGAQIPAGVISAIALFLLVLAIWVVGCIVSFVTSGALFALFEKLIGIVIIGAVIWWLLRLFFGRG